MFQRRDLLIAVLAFALGSTSMVAAAGQFVGPDGVIHACVTDTGALRLITAGGACVASPSTQQNETAISWGQVGPAGPTGPAGATGAAGTFAGTFTSPNGLYSISVTDNGILLNGPSGNVALDSNGLNVRAQSLVARTDANLALTVGGALAVRVSGDTTANYGGNYGANYAANAQETYGGNYAGSYGGNYGANYSGNYGANYAGNAAMTAAGTISIIAPAVLVGGSSGCPPVIRITDSAEVPVAGDGVFPVHFLSASTHVFAC